MKLKQMVGHDEIMKFVAGLYNGNLHAKRALSLANATLGVLASASLAVHAIGQGLAQAMGTLSKHGIKQVDRLLSNEGIDVRDVLRSLGWPCHRSPVGSRGGAGLDEFRT